MSTPDLLRELEKQVKEFVELRQWGKLEVSFSAGAPITIRKEVTKNLTRMGETHEHRNR